METTFKPSDKVLKQLVEERRKEVVRLQQSQAEQLKEIETRGQARIRALRASLPKSTLELLEKLAKLDTEESAISKSTLADIRRRLIASAPKDPISVHPGLGHRR